MDINKFLDFHNFSPKKLAIVTVIGSVFIIGILTAVVSLDNGKMESTTDKTSMGNVPEPNRSDVENDENTQSAYRYTNEFFEILVPLDWAVDTYAFNSGVEFTMRPRDAEENETVPSIQIEYYINDQQSVNGQKEGLLRLGTSETVTFQGVSAEKIRAVIPFKIVGDDYINSRVQQVSYFFSKSERDYIVEYKYDGSNIDEPIESQFSEILSTLEIY